MFRSLLPASVMLVAVVAACSGGSGAATTAPTARPATAAPASVAPASAASSAAAGPTVSASTEGFFVGPNGNTLYTFDKDTANTSNCGVVQCATNWPALVVP